MEIEKIRIETQTETVDSLLAKIQRDELHLNLSLKNRTSEEKTRPIEWLLLRIPLPPLYVLADGERALDHRRRKPRDSIDPRVRHRAYGETGTTSTCSEVPERPLRKEIRRSAKGHAEKDPRDPVDPPRDPARSTRGTRTRDPRPWPPHLRSTT